MAKNKGKGKATKPAERTEAETERLRLRGTLGGLARSASLSAEQRSESARKAGLASAAKRRAEREAAAKRRAEREAAGLPPIPPRERLVAPLEVLEPYLEQIDRERGDEPWPYERRIREATIRHRRDVAATALEAAKRRDGR